MTKATLAEGDQLRYSANWVTARRAWLKVFADRLVCGDWVIAIADIREAVLISLWQGVFPAYVLRIRTDEYTYSFGLNRGKYWRGELPFDVRREKGKLSYSRFSIAYRLVLLVGLAAYLWWSFQG